MKNRACKEGSVQNDGTAFTLAGLLIMSERADVCRKKAAECERHALLATDLTTRQMYLDLSRQWRQMAAQADELEQRLQAPW